MVKNYLLNFMGLCILAIGVSLTIHVSGVGLEPWSAAYVGLTTLHFTVGFWIVTSHIFFITLTYLLERRPPRLGTFINMLTVGPIIDLINALNIYPTITNSLYTHLFFLLGVIISNFGVGVVIVSTVGAGSKTQFYLTIHNKTGIRLSYCKYMIEFTGLTIALLTGGPIFIGTIISIILSGYVVEVSVKFLRGYLIPKDIPVVG